VNALQTVTILVVAGTAIVGLIDYLRRGGPLSQLSRLGRDGVVWFDRLADLPIDQRPSEDELDAPIPRRPLTGRP
jgi:hypothetical protein